MTDEQEWTALEAAQPVVTSTGEWEEEQDTGVPYLNKPHPLSYWPHLPMRGQNGCVPTAPKPVRAIATIAPREKCIIRKNAAHPDSYRPELPLRGYTYAQLTKPDKRDRAEWAARPLTYIKTGDTVSQPRTAPEPEIALADASVAMKANVANNKVKRDTRTRDALRRAFVAWLNGRAFWSETEGRYVVYAKRATVPRPAPWDDVVRATFPDPDAFHSAAESWVTPRTYATLRTH